MSRVQVKPYPEGVDLRLFRLTVRATMKAGWDTARIASVMCRPEAYVWNGLARSDSAGSADNPAPRFLEGPAVDLDRAAESVPYDN